MVSVLRVTCVSLLLGCAGNPGGHQFTCDKPGVTCIEFVSGYDRHDAMLACDGSSTFGNADCPSGRIAHCTTMTLSGAVAVTNFYPGFGTVMNAHSQCLADFSAP